MVRNHLKNAQKYYLTTETLRTQRYLSFLLSADPGGICSAFHRAEDAEKQNNITLRGVCPTLRPGSSTGWKRGWRLFLERLVGS